MGDGASIVAFVGVDDVPRAIAAAEAALREAGIVGGSHDPEAVLAEHPGLILRPGPNAAAATIHGEHINGVAFIGKRYFNVYALGFAEWFACPSCGETMTQPFDLLHAQVGNLADAAGAWCDGKDGATAQCLLCDATPPVRDWRMEDPVFLADMALEFWHWPYLDPDPVARAKCWHVDVVPILEAAVGAPAMLSGFKI